ncbi:HpcH/HpaI aldolase/citrate lyase family protein [Sphingosinicella sp.]|uniref:HpcH/HpaI aldolase/citrate lyase family protein n=1 Tax=Sphingosinicella sp. TaxID=1917971 RepID=UPI0040383C1E
MVVNDLHLCRSLLFLPASNPRAIEKARELPADMVILDLEDSVRTEDKAKARTAAVEAVSAFEGRHVAVRINAFGSDLFGADVVAFRYLKEVGIVLPKAEATAQVHDAGRLFSHHVLAMIETPAGVANARAIAAETDALIAGTNDLGLALGLPPGGGRAGLSYSLQAIVLAARLHGIAAFDGVYNGLEDLDGFAAECDEGRTFGFDGKSAIHPSQLATINRAFSPSEAEIAAARRLVAAETEGAERHEGRMVEALHVAQARALLAKAERGRESLASREAAP